MPGTDIPEDNDGEEITPLGVPINGASVHIDHETRLGLVFPIKVSRI